MTELITIYTRSDPTCSFCVRLKELLNIYGYDFYEKDIAEPENKKEFLEQGFRFVPQVFIGEKNIGGYETTKEYLRKNFFIHHPDKDRILKELEEIE